MRIISGKYRGMNLSEFKTGGIRPTADRVKESVFNILAAEIAGAKVLDLFCGSGGLGLECVSRGAGSVRFNDISEESIKVLKKNLLRINEKNIIISRSDFSVCLYGGKKYDLIFLAPPYKSDAGLRALEIIGQKNLLEYGGIAVYEHDMPFVEHVNGLIKFDERKYGITYVTFFKTEEL